MNPFRFISEILLITAFIVSIVASITLCIMAPLIVYAYSGQFIWLFAYVGYAIVGYLIYKLLA